MKAVPALLKAGVIIIDITPRFFCKGPEDFETVMGKLASA